MRFRVGTHAVRDASTKGDTLPRDASSAQMFGDTPVGETS
jgi:hypothetical protein